MTASSLLAAASNWSLVHCRRQPDVDVARQPTACGALVDRGGEASDHAGLAEPAHAVGGGVGAEAHGGAEVAERDPRVPREFAEDRAVCGIHVCDCRSSPPVPAGVSLEARYPGCMFAIGTDFLDPLVAGLVAGWGVAIPLGAIGVMIVDLGMRGGFRPAAAAAAGVATADFLYAAVAAAAGAAVAAVLAPHERTVQLLAARGARRRGGVRLPEPAAAPGRGGAGAARRPLSALRRAHLGEPGDRRLLRGADRRAPGRGERPRGRQGRVRRRGGGGVAELAARRWRARARRSTTACPPPRGSGPRCWATCSCWRSRCGWRSTTPSSGRAARARSATPAAQASARRAARGRRRAGGDAGPRRR